MFHLTYNLHRKSPVWIIPTKDLSFGTMIDRLLVYAPAISADPTQQESLKELRQGRSMGWGWSITDWLAKKLRNRME